MMIAKNTLLILGAGASRPYLFPTGAELRNLILERNENIELLLNMGFTPKNLPHKAVLYQGEDSTRMQYRIWIEDWLSVQRIASEELQVFQEHFAASQLYSIDAYIAANPFYKVLGSLMVAAILLKCEQEKQLDGDWYQLLFNELVSEGEDFGGD